MASRRSTGPLQSRSIAIQLEAKANALGNGEIQAGEIQDDALMAAGDTNGGAHRQSPCYPPPSIAHAR